MKRSPVLLTALLIPLAAAILLLAWLQPTAADQVPDGGSVAFYDTLTERGHIGGAARGVAIDGTDAFVGFGHEFAVVDTTDPANPERIGYHLLPAPITSIAISGSYAYVGLFGAPIQVLDVSDTQNPTVVATLPAITVTYDLTIDGAWLLVAADENGLQFVNVTDPDMPQLAGGVASPHASRGVRTKSNHAYLIDQGGILSVIDYTNVFAASVVTTRTISGANWGVATFGNGLYVTTNRCNPLCTGYVTSYDISEASNPVWRSEKSTGDGAARGVAAAGGYLFVARNDASGLHHENSLIVFDVSVPTVPTFADEYDTPGSYGALNVLVSGPRAYIAHGGAGLRILNASDPTSLDELGSLMPPANARAVASDNGQIYIGGGDGAGLGDLWLTDNDLNAIAHLQLSTVNQVTAIAAEGDWVYAAGTRGANGRFRLINVQTATLPIDYAGLVIDVPLGVEAAGQTVYVQDESGSRIIDVTHPLTPTQVGTIEVVGPMAIEGQLAAIAGGMSGLHLYDLATPTAPQPLGILDGGWSADDVVMSGTHAFVAAAGDGIYLVDLSEPLTPTIMAQFDPTWLPVDLHLDNHYLYVRDNVGTVHAVSISDPAALVEMGMVAASGINQVTTVGQSVIVPGGSLGVTAYQHGLTIVGTIQQANGVAWPGATIMAPGAVGSLSDGAGMYQLASLDAAMYTVTAQDGGFSFTPTQHIVTLPPSVNGVDFTVLAAPVSGTVTPAGATFTLTDPQGTTTTLIVPPNAVSSTYTLHMTSIILNDLPDVRFAAHGMEIALFDGSMQLFDFTFAEPLSLTVEYSAADIGGMIEESLMLRWLDDTGWVDAGMSCGLPLSQALDVLLRTVAVGVCETGRFGLFAPERGLFLPAIIRSE